MMLSTNRSDGVRTGITLELWQEFGEAWGAVVLCNANSLHQLFVGRVSQALRRARQSSERHGFEGSYDISGAEAVTMLHATDDLLTEIDDQLDALQSRVAASVLYSGSLAALAVMPRARAQLSRLLDLRNSVLKQFGVERATGRASGKVHPPASPRASATEEGATKGA